MQDGVWLRSAAPYPLVTYVNCNPVTTMPGVCCNTAVVPHAITMHGLQPFDIAEAVRAPSTRRVLINREGELGDVIAVCAAARALGKIFPAVRFAVAVHVRYVALAQTFEPSIDVVFGGEHVMRKRADGQVTVDLTGYLELDHTPGMMRVNRVERVLRLFGVRGDE